MFILATVYSFLNIDNLYSELSLTRLNKIIQVFVNAQPFKNAY